jgi:hypothetical protein
LFGVFVVGHDIQAHLGARQEMNDLRAQCLDETLRCIREYRAASREFRPFWRGLALYEISQFKRWFLVPERAAFLAAVERAKHRRAA